MRRLGFSLGVALFALAPIPDAASASSRPEVVQGDGTRVQGFFTAGDAGAVISIPGGARLELEPKATIRVFNGAQSLRMPGGYSVDTWSVAVRSGQVRAVVTKPKKSAILLTISEQFSLLVGQGTGVLIAHENEYTAANLAGVSNTIVSGHWKKLAPGAVRSLDTHGGPATTGHTLGATTLAPGQRLWISPHHPVHLTGFKWKPIDGARGYTVQLSRAGEPDPIANVETHEPRLSEPIGPVGPGQYELAVRGNDQMGLPGEWSSKVELRVLGVELPEGAYVSQSGIINLGRGQHARFTYADGLELTYSGAHRFIPASSHIPLHDGHRTLVSVREPGSLDVAIAKLQPRNITANVEIGPKTAVWPDDDVEISIQLQATSSEPPPNFIEPRPKVTVGIDPVEVAWRWEGSVLKGKVPPSESSGPWVVRVEVEDQFGLPLGRNFLEVVPRRMANQRRAARKHFASDRSLARTVNQTSR